MKTDDDVTASPTPVKRDNHLPELISVVIPAYNEAEHLGEQLASLSRQTYEGPWEVIIADNGSTDGTREVAEAWADRLPALKVVDASAEKGASFAHNCGARSSRGDFILFTNADDVADEGWLEHMAHAARHHDFIAGATDVTTLNCFERNAGRAVDLSWASTPSNFPFLPWGRGANLGMSRELFDDTGGWNTEYRYGGADVELCWRIQLDGNPIYLADDAKVHYRMRSGLRDLARQQFTFAFTAVKLYDVFRADGCPRDRTSIAIRSWAWLIVHSHRLFRGPTQRRMWVALAARRLGRLWGNVRLRVWYP